MTRTIATNRGTEHHARSATHSASHDVATRPRSRAEISHPHAPRIAWHTTHRPTVRAHRITRDTGELRSADYEQDLMDAGMIEGADGIWYRPVEV